MTASEKGRGPLQTSALPLGYGAGTIRGLNLPDRGLLENPRIVP